MTISAGLPRRLAAVPELRRPPPPGGRGRLSEDDNPNTDRNPAHRLYSMNILVVCNTNLMVRVILRLPPPGGRGPEFLLLLLLLLLLLMIMILVLLSILVMIRLLLILLILLIPWLLLIITLVVIMIIMMCHPEDAADCQKRVSGVLDLMVPQPFLYNT